MKLIERYIFRRMGSAAAMTFVALAAMLWLAQALRQFNLITANGQSLWTFLQVTLLLVPVLVTIVLPFAALIAVIYTLTTLNGESELAVINASGAPQWSVLKPAVLIGAIAVVGIGAMTLYFAPLSLQRGQALITSVRGNILTSIIHEGQFMSLGGGLTFHMRGRGSDGTLQGILVVDDREATKTTTYLAENGAILDNPLGVFLIMTNGVIQQRSKTEHSISMIEFSSYAFDLSSFSSGAAVATLQPRERSTLYLLNPDPDDPYFRQFPEQFRTELHTRLTLPLYGMVFALLPLAFVGQAESPRQSRAANVALLGGVSLVVGGIGFFLPNAANASPLGVALMYVVPLAVIALSATLVLLGAQVRPSERVMAIGEAVFGRIGRLLRPGAGPVEGVS